MFILKEEEIRKIDLKIDSSTRSAVRTTVATGRCLEKKKEYYNMSKECPGSIGALVFVFKGDHTAVGGHGHVFDRFCQTGVISEYPGKDEKVVSSSEDNYETAGMKLMKFHETFKYLRYDVNHSKWNVSNVHLLL